MKPLTEAHLAILRRRCECEDQRFGGQSIIVGTPSGVTLAPEGGAHQSITTPSIGLEQPGCIAWEPAFGQDLEWALLEALGRLGKPRGESSYFRRSTRPISSSTTISGSLRTTSPSWITGIASI